MSLGPAMHPPLEQQRSAGLGAVQPDTGIPGSATVAVCAYTIRRWEDLTAAVASVVRQLRPADECIVVVDHNEKLRAKAEAWFAAEPSVRVLANAGPRGLSGARNTAVADARGEVVAFLDDDALPGDEWLPGMLAALSDGDVLGVGCAAVPRWPDGQRPAWFPPEFDWVVGCSYRGLPKRRAEVRNVIGAAMAFRREAFELAGTFSTDMGRVGAAPTGCEETELCIRVRRARPGARVLYLPDVSVSHRVTEDRLRRRYFLRRCLGEGRSKAWVSRLQGAGQGLASERDYVRRVLPAAVLRELRRAVRGDGSGLIAVFLIVAGVFAAGVGFVQARLTRGGLHGGA